MTNADSIKFEYIKEDEDLFNSDQKELWKSIEQKYLELKNKCLDNIEIKTSCSHKEWVTCRVNLHVTTSIMRLLYLTESFCDNSKKFNSVASAANIKSMVEIPMHLGYLLWIISEHSTFDTIKPKLHALAFGNRDHDTGLTNNPLISQKELHKKTDLMLKKLFDNDENTLNIIETVYKEANAIGHHNFEGRNLLNGVQNGDASGGVWRQKDRKEWFVFISGQIFQLFFYADTILQITSVLENAIAHCIEHLPETIG
jgi:hypothetical protein